MHNDGRFAPPVTTLGDSAMTIEETDVFQLGTMCVVVTEIFDDGFFGIEITPNPLWGGRPEEVDGTFFDGLVKLWSWSEKSVPNGATIH